ncbi:MAG: hypothetical protein WAK33_14995, partial [Silvibacterium sp.]
HQISHTKGFVADGKVAGEGSTNWSTSGEGVFVVTGQPGGKGFVAQNNTQSIITDPDTISRFTAELIAEHMAAQKAAMSDPTNLRRLRRRPTSRRKGSIALTSNCQNEDRQPVQLRPSGPLPVSCFRAADKRRHTVVQFLQ